MIKTRIRRASVLLFAVVAWLSCQQALAEKQAPNFVLILADDLRCGDISCYTLGGRSSHGDLTCCGSPAVKTPQLAGLAEEGMQFIRFYAGFAVCSPRVRQC